MYKDILLNWNFNPIGDGYWILTKDIYLKDCGETLMLSYNKMLNVFKPSVLESIVKSYGKECTFEQFYEELINEKPNIISELAMNLYNDRKDFVNTSVLIYKDQNNRIQVVFDKFQVCRLELFDDNFLITADHELVDKDKNVLYSFFYQSHIPKDIEYEYIKYYISLLYEKFKVFYDKYLSM